MRLHILNEVVVRDRIQTDRELRISVIDPEEDWELADAVLQIASKVSIRFNRNKDVRIIAMVGDTIIGGAAIDERYQSQYFSDQEEQYAVDFDVVVDPQWQGYSGVGIKLIKAVERYAADIGAAQLTALVVNCKLAKYMGEKMGYEGYDELEKCPVRLEKYVSI